jgi:hypothetical protein
MLDDMKQYQLWRVDSAGKQIECVAESDSLDEILQYRRQSDLLYGVYEQQRRLPDFDR